MKKKRKNRKNIKNSYTYKYIIPGIVAIVLVIAIFLGTKSIPKHALGSIYGINDLNENFDIIQIGDIIEYEINGYSDWQVIGKNDANETIDVISKGNTETITFETFKEKEYYEQILEETAKKYVSDNLIVNARCVNEEDLARFSNTNNNNNAVFWIDNVQDDKISISNNQWWYYNFKNYNMYAIPYIKISENDTSSYTIGDKYSFSANGIENWVVCKIENNYLYLIPETPIRINVNQDSIWGYMMEFYNYGVVGAGYYWDLYRSYSQLPEIIGDFLQQQDEKIYFYISGCYTGTDGYGNAKWYCSIGLPYYENGAMGEEFPTINYSNYGTIFHDTSAKTFGFRPVLTIRANKMVDKKDVTEELEVGDYVNYSSNGYENWKVLSIDEDSNTVDIISGKPTKNITLSGKNDYDNLNDILQEEANSYKNESGLSARVLRSSDIDLLDIMNDKPRTEFWINNKKNIKKDEAVSYSGSNTLSLISSSVAVLYYDDYNQEISRKWIPLSIEFASKNGDVLRYYRESGIYINPSRYFEGNQSYTAGLRPVISLRTTDVEKIDEQEVEKVEKMSENLERKISAEQESKNKDYKGPSKVDDTTSSTGDKTITPSDDSKDKSGKVEKIVYKDEPFYKYGFFILLVICLIETLLLIIPKINKK